MSGESERRRKRRRQPMPRGVRIALIVVGLVVVAAAFQTLLARRHLVQARAALENSRTSLASGKSQDASQALNTAAHAFRAARAHTGLPGSVLHPIPVVGSPGRAVDATIDAGMHVVAAGRFLAKAEEAFPTSRHVGLDGRDLSALNAAALGARAPLASAEKELAAANRDLGGPAGALLPPVSSPARSVRAVVGEAQNQLLRVKRGLGLLAALTSPTADVKLLVLSQDTWEARPTGGYIGTFGVLRFAHGTVSLDQYAATGALPRPSP